MKDQIKKILSREYYKYRNKDKLSIKKSQKNEPTSDSGQTDYNQTMKQYKKNKKKYMRL